MSGGKAQFGGKPNFTERVKLGVAQQPDVFTEDVKRRIANLCPSKSRDQRAITADEFMNEVVSESRFAEAEVIKVGERLRKKDKLAEAITLLHVLRKKEVALRALSPDFESLLDISVNPLDVADALRNFIVELKRVIGVIQRDDQVKMKPAQLRRAVADELTIRLMRVARKYGMPITAHGTPNEEGSFSQAVKLMKIVGDAVGLKYALPTWRNIVAFAKKKRFSGPRAGTRRAPK